MVSTLGAALGLLYSRQRELSEEETTRNIALLGILGPTVAGIVALRAREDQPTRVERPIAQTPQPIMEAPLGKTIGDALQQAADNYIKSDAAVQERIKMVAQAAVDRSLPAPATTTTSATPLDAAAQKVGAAADEIAKAAPKIAGALQQIADRQSGTTTPTGASATGGATGEQTP